MFICISSEATSPPNTELSSWDRDLAAAAAAGNTADTCSVVLGRKGRTEEGVECAEQMSARVWLENGWGMVWTECLCPPKMYMVKPTPQGNGTRSDYGLRVEPL